MNLLLVFSHILLVSTAATINGPSLIKFNEQTLNKLRLIPSVFLKSASYIDFAILNEYQCAIECVKDQSRCTGYAYDASQKMCSLYDDSTRTVDSDIVELRKEVQPNVCDKVTCKPGAICVDYDSKGNKVPTCVCLNGQLTPDDCDQNEANVWTEYDDWSACSVTCGEGYRFRKRRCLAASDRTQKLPSDQCVGKDMEIQPCDITHCPVYGPWSAWTPCSTFCGIGHKQRNRSCNPPGSNCGNYTHEQRACGEANCQRVAGIKQTEAEKSPLKGYLAIREGDILCVPQNSSSMAKHMADLVCKSIGLARGAQYAFLNPIRFNSTCYPGILCDGTETDFYNCKYDRSVASGDISELFAIVARCIVDGEFSSWSEWSPCTKSCGAGQMTRSRLCNNPSPSIPEPEITLEDPSLAGRNCTGEYTQVKTCNEQPCQPSF